MLLQQTNVAVVSDGEDVVLSMGSSQWRLHYESALALSVLMRSAARKAKRFAGDMSRVYSVLGTLHDAEKGPDAAQPFTPGRVYPVNRPVLKLEEIGARQEGPLVVTKLGRDEAAMPYQAAQVIGQWVRLRAKEAQRRVGDVKRHWSAIVPLIAEA